MTESQPLSGTPGPAPVMTFGRLALGAFYGSLFAVLLWVPFTLTPFWQDDYALLYQALHTPLMVGIFPTEPVGFWRPISMDLWWRIGVRLVGTQPLGWHLASLGLLLLVGTLAGSLGARWAGLLGSRGTPKRAAAAAFVYTAHGAFFLPVAWASASQELLCLFGALIAFTGWTAVLLNRRPVLAELAVLGGTAFALLSKDGAVVIPALALLMALRFRPSHRMMAVGAAMIALCGLYLYLRSRYVAAPSAGSPYELTIGRNVIRNGISLFLFGFNVPREALHLLMESRPLAGVWGGVCGLLTATAAALLVTAWRRSLGGRTLAAFAVWFAVGVSPYLLLRWNCYPYYALFGLLPLTVLAAAASDSRFSSKALALYATSVVLVLAGQYVVPFPATLARARLAEESLRLIRSQQVQQAPVYIVIEQAESEFNAVGWEKGIALRTGTEADRWQVTTTPPDNATILRFRPRTTPIWESSE